MAQTLTKKKRRKQQLSFPIEVQEETVVQNAIEVTEALDELAWQGKK